jgi:predicted HD superfamily hydrolase involved in NAD metabolism
MINCESKRRHVQNNFILTLDEMKNKLKERLSTKRYEHSLNVMYECVKLADIYGCNKEKAQIAGLLHDCAREIRDKEALEHCKQFGIKPDKLQTLQTDLLHGALGAVIAYKDFGIRNKNILSAIKWHTTGHENMSLLEKIVFIADYIEPGRDFEGVNKLREVAVKDIEGASILAMDLTIQYVLKKGALLHPQSIKARNHIVASRGQSS